MKIFCLLFGHSWDFECYVVLKCGCCSDERRRCKRCPETLDVPSYRRWRCPLHEPPRMLA